ncbi:hypothetical protein SAMN05443254_11919 [Bradyrhizobium sp. OK095]|nr:hypothetical protein SAMN05443254_11919 [Bradyrhizobium sp. OK095]
MLPGSAVPTIEGSLALIDYLGGHRHAQKMKRDDGLIALHSFSTILARNYFAAVTMISTVYCAAASLASTVARAGVLPGETQASHAAFISPKVFMSVM